jgi:hypothetical protein
LIKSYAMRLFSEFSTPMSEVKFCSKFTEADPRDPTFIRSYWIIYGVTDAETEAQIAQRDDEKTAKLLLEQLCGHSKFIPVGSAEYSAEVLFIPEIVTAHINEAIELLYSTRAGGTADPMEGIDGAIDALKPFAQQRHIAYCETLSVAG